MNDRVKSVNLQLDDGWCRGAFATGKVETR